MDTLFKVTFSQGEQEKIAFVKKFDHLLGYIDLFKNVSIEQITCIDQLHVSDLEKNQGVAIYKGTLASLFYSGVTYDCALPQNYLDHLVQQGADFSTLVSGCITDCSTLVYKLLPLTLEAKKELEKVGAF